MFKKMTTLTQIPEENKKITSTIETSKSMESLYSSGSSRFSTAGLHRRKNAARQPTIIPAVSEVRQRVMSARMQRFKHLQNQLTDAHKHIAELSNENRILLTLYKRQDTALSKYENTNAELPQLLNAHAEEIRTWQTKYRKLQTQNKELSVKLKQKDIAILAINDQNKHLLQLNRDKNLEEREKLSERVIKLEARLVEKDNDTKLLARKLQLESKTFKTQLQHEQQKYKELYQKFENINLEMAKMNAAELAEKKSSSSLRSFHNSKTLRSIRETKSTLNFNNMTSSLLPLHGQKFLNSNGGSSKSPLSDNSKSSGPSDQSKGSNESLSVTKKNSIKPHKNINNLRPQISKLENSEDIKFDRNKKDLPILGRNGLIQMKDIEGFIDNEKSLKLAITESDDCSENGVNSDYGKDEESDDDLDSHLIDRKKEMSFKNSKLKQDDNLDEESVADFEEEQIRKEDEFAIIKKQFQEESLRKEEFLDSFCDNIAKIEVTDSVAVMNQNGKLSSKFEHFEMEKRRQHIDPKRKVKLLAALKAIDADESFDS